MDDSTVARGHRAAAGKARAPGAAYRVVHESFHGRSPANFVGDVTRQLEWITLPSSDRQRIGLASMPFGLVPATAGLFMRPRRDPKASRSA